MPGVTPVQNTKQGGLATAMQGLQAYGAVNGIVNSNAQTDAMQRRQKMLEGQQGPRVDANGNPVTLDQGG